MNLIDLERWLSPLDSAPVECDGFTHCAAYLFRREGVGHHVRSGRLIVDGVGTIGLHFWIEGEGGYVCDFRARLWLGDSERVPHGVFIPEAFQHYEVIAPVHKPVADEFIFQVLTGIDPGKFPPFLSR